ncbi:MAG: carboxypeptidase regulatory-like domain-containing protein [Deferribacteres bacterium]|nr:carboxypeptidase regulatory-like domain-containing protein [candidate division KSB1 bacterium]MCB9501194.1 carboxypeptidase regulatory-like domain-containing protein [Deferribacteres bacterium]
MKTNKNIVSIHRDWWARFSLFTMVLFFFIATYNVHAQQERTYTVKGKILSLTDGLPIKSIKVVLKGTDFSAETDSNGTFRIVGVNRGVYDIVAKYPDFDATVLKDVAIPPTEKKDYVFNLTSNDHFLPYADQAIDENLGLLQGTVHVKIDTFKNFFSDGRLILRAAKAGELTSSYLYPRHFEILPVTEQDFRFQFYLPRGQKYHLYLLWQRENNAYVFEQIVDIARDEFDAASAKQFDLKKRSEFSQIKFSLHTDKLNAQ